MTDGLFWIQTGRYVMTFLMIFISVAMFYYLGTKEGRNISFISPGAILTTILILVNFRIFSIYVNKHAKY